MTIMQVKMRTDQPINALDFGIPPAFVDLAENYVNWAVAAEREACAKICESNRVGFPSYFEIDEHIQECVDSIRARSAA